jgi:hypothetical protein
MEMKLKTDGSMRRIASDSSTLSLPFYCIRFQGHFSLLTKHIN